MPEDNMDETMPSKREDNIEETTPSLKEGDTAPTRVFQDITNEADANAETQQIGVDSEEEPQPLSKKKRWLRGILTGVVIFIAVAGLGILGGYQAGVSERIQEATKVSLVEAATQFELAKIDFNEGRLDIARQRVEYVIRLNPAFPGAADMLAQIQLALLTTSTATPEAADTLTPTPDDRGKEELFAQALAMRNEGAWDQLISTLDTLRKMDPAFHTVEVDGMYWVAYRNRGADRILKEGNLEGGIFDLDRAELYGSLDVEAQSYRQWAGWYITGASFWEIDWGQAIQYFSLISNVAPNLSDSNYFTVSSRLATAQVEYAYVLVTQADWLLSLKGWCDANALYQQAAQYAPLDPTVYPTAEYAALKCELNPDEQPRTPEP